MRRVAEPASRPMILAPGGVPGAVPRGTMTRPAAPAGRFARSALAPGGPIRVAPISTAPATLAVQAGHFPRFSIQCLPRQPTFLAVSQDQRDAKGGGSGGR